jgi:hypothetical protein
MPEKVIQTATTPDRIEFFQGSKTGDRWLIGIKVSDLMRTISRSLRTTREGCEEG